MALVLASTIQTQHGCITRQQILDAGFTSRQIEHRTRCGLLVRTSQNVYRSVAVVETARSRLWAAHLGLPKSVVSHRSAACWFGYSDPPDRPELSVPMTINGALSGVVVHRRRISLEQRTITVDGLRITRPEVTVLELASQLNDRGFTALVDRYAAGNPRRIDRLIPWFDEVCGQGRPGTVRARRELTRRRCGDIAESPLERLFLEVIDESPLPRPTLQWTPPWDGGIRSPARGVGPRFDSRGRTFATSPSTSSTSFPLRLICVKIRDCIEARTPNHIWCGSL